LRPRPRTSRDISHVIGIIVIASRSALGLARGARRVESGTIATRVNFSTATPRTHA